MMEMLQAFAALVAAGSSLTMSIVVLRWSASLEATVKRMDSVLDNVQRGNETMRVSE